MTYQECVQTCADICRTEFPKTNLTQGLEYGLIVLIILLIIIGFIIGFLKLKQSYEEEKKGGIPNGNKESRKRY